MRLPISSVARRANASTLGVHELGRFGHDDRALVRTSCGATFDSTLCAAAIFASSCASVVSTNVLSVFPSNGLTLSYSAAGWSVDTDIR